MLYRRKTVQMPEGEDNTVATTQVGVRRTAFSVASVMVVGKEGLDSSRTHSQQLGLPNLSDLVVFIHHDLKIGILQE